jgi:hypothetical protein
MTRGDGFTTADIDTGLLDDAKMRHLWRLLRDPATMARAVVVYTAAVLASWRTGDRVTAEDAAPLWNDPADLLAPLVTVGLLDAEHRVPLHVWTAWYGPAYARTEAKRGGGRIAGLMAHGMTRDQAIAEALRRKSLTPSQAIPGDSSEIAGPALPSPVPPLLPAPPLHAREGDDGSKEPLTTKRNGQEGPKDWASVGAVVATLGFGVKEPTP